MSAFACAAAAPGAPLPAGLRARLAAAVAAPGSPAAELAGDGFAAAAGTEPDAPRPLLARRGALLAVGEVRLDNPAEVAAWGGVRAARAADLELVLAAYAARGAGCLDGVLGDFAFALWDGGRGTLTAMRDPFGVKGLFLAGEGGALVLSSRLEALAREGDFDEEWVADFLVGGAAHSERTVWAGVRAVGPGERLTWGGGLLASRKLLAGGGLRPGGDRGRARGDGALPGAVRGGGADPHGGRGRSLVAALRRAGLVVGGLGCADACGGRARPLARRDGDGGRHPGRRRRAPLLGQGGGSLGAAKRAAGGPLGLAG